MAGVRSNANYEFVGSDHQCQSGFRKKPPLAPDCLQQPAQGAAHDLFAIVASPLEISTPCASASYSSSTMVPAPMIGTVLMLFFGLPARNPIAVSNVNQAHCARGRRSARPEAS